MKKRLLTFIYGLIFIILITSCANSKVLTINNVPTEIKPYGWANAHKRKNDNVIYKVSTGNVIWSVIGLRILVVPIWLTGWQLFEAYEVKPVVEVESTENKN
jgi:hypothetical protein